MAALWQGHRAQRAAPMPYSAAMPSRLPARQQALAETPAAAPTERPAVRAYRLQLQRVDKLRAQLAELDTLAQWQRDERLRALLPLQRQAQRLAADLVRALDAALQDAPDDGLGPRHRAAAAQALCEHARALAESGDAALAADMTALHDRHSRDSIADLRRAAAQALRSELEGYFGRPLHGADAAADEEDVLHAARQQWHTEREAARAKKAAKAAARQARQGSATTAPDAPAPADPAQEARRIYRQLASALHPDRVPEGPERAAMTALMQQANQAYESKDLLKLLDLQARLDSHAAGNAEQRAMGLSAATLRHYNQLLGQELEDLRAALLIEEDQLLDAHPHVAPFLMGRTNGKTRAEVLAKAGQHELRLLRLQIEEAQASLKALSNGASGRRWLAGQRQRQREADEDSELDQFLTSLLDDGPPGFGPGGFGDTDGGNPFAPPRRRRRRGPPDDIPF